ncbi:MAG TPA: FAD binding domain-containing protein [Acetobacteraceae bacterium]|nr:FAD binding domain-containing protein [Acetobacteraceae bacterium]
MVIGGSMGGLLTALLLRRSGWHVDVFERVGSELAGRGAGIVTHGELFDVPAHAGISVSPETLGISVPGRRVFNQAGDVAGELRLEQVLTSWGRLYALLRNALPDDHYHHGKTFVRAEEDESGVTAHFDDRTSVRADLLVGADGLFSTVRRQYLPDAEPRYVGYVAWRGLVEEAELSSATRDALCDWFAFSLAPSEQMLGYPVAGTDEALASGRRRFNFVWYRPAAPNGALTELLTGKDGTKHQLSIPPHCIRETVIAGMREDAENLLAPQFAEVVRHTKQPFIQAILDFETPRMALGQTRRIAIIGDAAFVARPHVGMGVTKAAGDAAALSRALSDHPADVSAGVLAFERERLPYGAAVVRRARHLGAYMQAQLLTQEERTLAERHRSPEAVMAETAVATGITA